MAHQSALAQLTHTTSTVRRSRRNLLRDMTVRAATIEASREQTRRKRRRDALTHHCRLRERVSRAYAGLAALLDIAGSPEFQKFIDSYGKPLPLWGGTTTFSPGGDMMDVHWRWTSSIVLTPTGMLVQNYGENSGDHGVTFELDRHEGPFSAMFFYAVEDAWLRTKALWRIATPFALDLKEMAEHGDKSDIYSTQVLFEFFVECADPKKLDQFMRRALGLATHRV